MDDSFMAIITSIMLMFGFMNGYIMAKISHLSHVAQLTEKLDEMKNEIEELNDTINELEQLIEEFENMNEYIKSILDGKVCLPPPPPAKRTETYGIIDDDEVLNDESSNKD